MDILKQYILALAATNSFAAVDLRSLISGAGPGTSDSNPMVVRVVEKYGLIKSFGSVLLFLALLYFLFYRNGPMGDMFSSQYVPVETNIKITFKDVKGSDEAKEELVDIGNG